MYRDLLDHPTLEIQSWSFPHTSSDSCCQSDTFTGVFWARNCLPFWFFVSFIQYTWRPEVQYQFCWAETSMSAKQPASGESESSLFPCILQLLVSVASYCHDCFLLLKIQSDAFHLPLDYSLQGGWPVWADTSGFLAFCVRLGIERVSAGNRGKWRW